MNGQGSNDVRGGVGMEPGVRNQFCHVDSEVFEPPQLPGFVRFFGASLIAHLLLFSGFVALQMNVNAAPHRSPLIEVELRDMEMKKMDAPPLAGPRTVSRPASAPTMERPAPSRPVTERSTPKPEAVPAPLATQPASASADATPVAASSAPAVSVPAGATAGGSTGGVGPVAAANGGGGGSGGIRDVAFGGANGPSFLARVLPNYPLAARRMGREGKVLLRLTLDERGKLLHVDVLENPGYGFADAALDAVRKSRFLPAHSGDRPIACRVRLPIRFALQTGE